MMLVQPQEIAQAPTTETVKLNPTELTLEEKVDAIFRFTQQFGELMEQVMPMVAKLAEHPMISAFMGG